MTEDEKIEAIVEALDDFSFKFDQAVADINKRRTIHRTIDKLRNIRIGTVGETIKSLFIYYSAKMNAKNAFDEMLEVLEFDMLKIDLTMSETHVRKLDDELKSIIIMMQKIDYSVPPEWINFNPNADLDIRQLDAFITEVCDLYEKYDNTMALFIKFLENRITPEINIKLEAIKQKIFNVNNGKQKKSNNINNVNNADDHNVLSLKSVPLNLIQTYGIIRGRPTTLSAIFNVKNASEKILPKLSKKHGYILLIKSKSNIRYDTWQMEDLTEGKGGLTLRNVELMDTVKRIGSNVKDSIILYCDGKALDVMKMRNTFSHIDDYVSELALGIQYVIETADDSTFYNCEFDATHLVYLLSGVNPLIALFNSESEEAIMGHWTGPKEITWTSTHTPIAHLRQEIKEKIMLYWKKHGVDVNQFQSMFNDVMFDAFNSYIGTGKGGIVRQEALVSYVSDINIRGRRFIREFNNVYNKFESDNKSSVQLQNEIESIIGSALDMCISEKDNIFNTIDEKRSLFNLFL